MTRSIVQLAHAANQHVLRTLAPSFSLHRELRTLLETLLPEDAADRARGRLFVSLTVARNKRNLLVTDFRGKEDLIEAVAASSFVPAISGFFPPR